MFDLVMSDWFERGTLALIVLNMGVLALVHARMSEVGGPCQLPASRRMLLGVQPARLRAWLPRTIASLDCLRALHAPRILHCHSPMLVYLGADMA
jgi:hypothetical protein